MGPSASFQNMGGMAAMGPSTSLQNMGGMAAMGPSTSVSGKYTQVLHTPTYLCHHHHSNVVVRFDVSHP
jgi:hypothetical protein